MSKHQRPNVNSSRGRAAINRANAQHSTGPRTSEGKQRSSLNALRHGVTSQAIVLPSEDPETYQRHLQSFIDEYKPKGPTEAHFVETLADTTWRLKRVAAFEARLMTGDAVDCLHDQIRALATVSTHGHRLERQFQSARRQLQEIQEARRQQERSLLLEAGRLLQMDKEDGVPFDPAADGFVLTIDEIETFLRRESRRDQALEAEEDRLAEAA